MQSGFPRLQRRGPIEARHRAEHLGAQPLFPRLQRRGPIEAWWMMILMREGIQFPRLQRRGPIEARRNRTVRNPRRIISTSTKTWPH